MNTHRIALAPVGGAVAGYASGFAIMAFLGVVNAVETGDLTSLPGGVLLGLLAGLFGIPFGLAVGVSCAAVAGVATLAVRLLGESVSQPLMIVAGAAGTIPASVSYIQWQIQDTSVTYYDFQLYAVTTPIVAVGAPLVIAAIAAVSLRWLFNLGTKKAGARSGDDAVDQEASTSPERAPRPTPAGVRRRRPTGEATDEVRA